MDHNVGRTYRAICFNGALLLQRLSFKSVIRLALLLPIIILYLKHHKPLLRGAPIYYQRRPSLPITNLLQGLSLSQLRHKLSLLTKATALLDIKVQERHQHLQTPWRTSSIR